MKDIVFRKCNLAMVDEIHPWLETEAVGTWFLCDVASETPKSYGFCCTPSARNSCVLPSPESHLFCVWTFEVWCSSETKCCTHLIFLVRDKST